jgi:PadR family transcriptional regulator PadR
MDLLILKALSLGSMHGWGISERIRGISRDAFRVGQGTLYPALHRYERRGWVISYWWTTEHNRTARYYGLTAAGWQVLETEIKRWRNYTHAIHHVISAD